MTTLLSSKPSDSGLTVALHPLILLTVSDQITRREIRGLAGPVVGIILGQQKGREITAEQAFPTSVIENTTGDWVLDQEWMERRIQQYKDVHKAPLLDVVGWFSLCPETGPTRALVAIQQQMVDLYNENAVLLAIHPEAIADSNPTKANGKLPVSVYESVVEAEKIRDEGSMQVDGEETTNFEFRTLPYSIETDETEMIAIDYIAKGAGTAVAVVEEPAPAPEATAKADKKGKKRADVSSESEKEVSSVKEPASVLTIEEEDQIAGITTRLNSVRMLQSRLSSISAFLRSLPPSSLSDASIALSDGAPGSQHLPYLRNIQALVTRLALLTPPTQASESLTATSDPLIIASQSQANDVSLSALLALLGQDVQSLSEMGRKFATVEYQKTLRSKGSKGNFGIGEQRDDRLSFNMIT